MSKSAVEVTTDIVLRGARAAIDQIEAKRKDFFEEEVEAEMAVPRKRWPWSKPTYMSRFQAESWVASGRRDEDLIWSDWEVMHDEELESAKQLLRAANLSAGPTMSLSVGDADIISRALDSELFRAKPRQTSRPQEGAIHDADRFRFLEKHAVVEDVFGDVVTWQVELPKHGQKLDAGSCGLRHAVDKAMGHTFEPSLTVAVDKLPGS